MSASPIIAAPSAASLRPGIGATIYGNLPRDIAADIVRASDFVTLHTAADATDVYSAARVRELGCDRVWLAVPANYFVRIAQRTGQRAAEAEARRCARVACGMRAEVFEFNGEGSSDASKPGDWVPADAAEAKALADLAAAIIAAAVDELKGTGIVVAWTSHDMPSFKLPWGAILAHVGLHSPQHYPAQSGRMVGQVELAARIARSSGRWDALADLGAIPASVVPITGESWVPYLQGWGHDVKALVGILPESRLARLWAYPGSWSPEGTRALVLARRLRAAVGHGPGTVRSFQRAHGFTADGIVGRITLAAVEALAG